MSKGKTKRILLSLMLCGTMCSTAYAAVEIPDPIPDGTEWTIGSGEDEVQLHSGTYNIAAGATVTMTEKSDHSNLEGDALYDTEGTALTVNGSADASGKYSTLIINGYSSVRENAIYSSGTDSVITLKDLDLTVNNYQQALTATNGGQLSIISENMDNTITINDSAVALNGSGGYTEITVGGFTATGCTTYGIECTDAGEVYVTANLLDIEGPGSGSGQGILASGGGIINIAGDKITIGNFLRGVDSQQNGTIIINHTGAGDEDTLNFKGNNIGVRAERGGIVRITSDGTINFSDNTGTTSAAGISVVYVSSQDYSEDSPAVSITGKGNTVINFDNNRYGMLAQYYNYGIKIENVKEMNFTNTGYIAIDGKGAYHGVDIDQVGAINIDTSQYGIVAEGSNNWPGKYAVNITNIEDLTVKNCSNYGLYSEDGHGVNITVTDGGSVTVDGNSGGIYTMRVEGITIKGTDDDYFSKFAVTGNGTGIYVDGGGTLDFSTRELVATGNGTFAYASGTGTGGTDDNKVTYDTHSSAITLTADKATITGQSENPSNDYTLYAASGGNITLDVGEIEASRDTGYFGYADTNEDSKIEIKADTGTIKGAFWTGDTGNTTADSSGIINLDLGTSTEWTVTDDSKVTKLTMGDASGLVFSYLGSEGGTGGFLNLYTSNMASGSGSNITMNINASALNESDHIYIDGEHTGTSVINLNANGSDLSDTVLGTILVSVNTESGSFTAGSGTNGTYEGALYNWKYTLAMADGTEESRKIQKTGELMTMDDYKNDWYLTDVEIETEEEPEPGDGGDPGPGPAQPNPGGGTPTTTTTVEAIKAANAVNYYAFRETDKLLRRMGELRNNGEDEQGVWIRVKGAKTGRNGSFENKYVHYEGGYDHLVKNDHREKRYEGVSISHTEGDVKYKEVTGSGKAHDEEIAFYRVDQYKHGHYLDLVTRIGIYNNRFGVYDTNQNKIHGKNHNYGVSTSAEYGRKKDYAHDWYVEPQTQATLGYLSGNDYTTSNQVDVSNGSISSAVGRIGVNIGKGFTDKNGRRGKFYAKANWLKEFLGSYGIDMTTENSRRHAHGNYKDTWFEWGFGVTYQYTKNNFFYADVEKSQGSAYYKNWAWNVGLRWTFN